MLANWWHVERDVCAGCNDEDSWEAGTKRIQRVLSGSG
ncbi:hypothetical protein RESH_00778 [Rhodopirellula europaea SH398]|uniref:Uncharacterized protein n=1 Tax=Rhodopirellula europaea SH398 TaxID=1263868 RepID=M5SAU2_9BACT|nr:hypothetical protein RESH_00778 [Rhodopirellula europaea SH398]